MRVGRGKLNKGQTGKIMKVVRAMSVNEVAEFNITDFPIKTPIGDFLSQSFRRGRTEYGKKFKTKKLDDKLQIKRIK